MALPITKKAAASCAKNMAEGTMVYQIDPDLADSLIKNAGETAPKFNNAKKELMAGFDNVKSKNAEDDED